MPKTDLTTKAALAATGFVIFCHAAGVLHLDSWGVDSLSYVSTQAQLLAALLALIVIIPGSRSRIVEPLRNVASKVDPWESSARSTLFAVVLGGVGLVAFVSFPTTMHLLGDGALYIRELDTHVWESTLRMDRAPLSFFIVRAVHRWADSGEVAYRIVSSACGIAFLLLAVAVARTVSNSAVHRWAILAFLTTQGYMVLFFGYAENYGLVLATAMAFLVLGLRVIRRDDSVWIPAVALGLVIPIHFSLAAFIPSLVVLASGWPASRETKGGESHAHRLLKALGAPSLTLAVAVAILVALKFDFAEFVEQSGASQMIPFLPAQSYHVNTWLLAPAHLWDVLNQYVLAAPGALIGLALILRRLKRPLSPELAFAMTAAAFPLLFTFLANPQIGAFRDWDVFAFAAVPLALVAAVVLARIAVDANQLAHVATVICGVTAIQTAVWIGVNAQPALAEERFRSNLANERLSIHARAYGWDTLGSIYEPVSLPKALDAFDRTTRIHPSNYRYWMNAGSVAAQMGRFEESVRYLQEATQAEPRAQQNRDLFYNLGSALEKTGEREQAVEAFRRAIALDPNVTDAYINLANTYVGLGRLEEALESYETARSVNGNVATIHYNIGGVLNRLGRHEPAIAAYEKAIELHPAYTKAYFNLAYSHHVLGRPQTALDTYMKALELGADWPQLYTNVAAVLRSLGRESEAAEWQQKASKASSR